MQRIVSVMFLAAVAACTTPQPEAARSLPRLAVVDPLRVQTTDARLEVANFLISVRLDRARAYTTAMTWTAEDDTRRAALVHLMARLRPLEESLQAVLTALREPSAAADDVVVLRQKAAEAMTRYQAMRPRLTALIGAD